MRKKLFLNFVTLFMLVVSQAFAEEGAGAWVKVNSNGEAISDAIMCSTAVCGSNESSYAQATLQLGERYVQQTNHSAGYGANNNTSVTVDNAGIWTIAKEKEIPVLITPLPVSARTIETTKSQFKVEDTSNGRLNDYVVSVTYETEILPIVPPDAAKEKINEKMAEPDFYKGFFDLFGNWVNWWDLDWESWFSTWTIFNWDNWLGAAK
jgi:hypothetical protein